MSTAATSRASPPSRWVSQTPSRNLSRPTTTPHGLPARTPGSAGQPTSTSAGLSTKARSPYAQRTLRTPSPSYFEYVVDPGSNPPNLNAGGHAKKNWNQPSSDARPHAATSRRGLPLEAANFDAFRRQSETNEFNLSHGNLVEFSMGSGENLPTLGSLKSNKARAEMLVSPRSLDTAVPDVANLTPAANRMDVDVPPVTQQGSQSSLACGTPSFFDMPRAQSPSNSPSLDLSNSQRSQLSHISERDPRHSLPHNRVDPPSPALSRALSRAETLPGTLTSDGPTMCSPEDVVDLLENYLSQDILLLDLRVYPQYSQSRLIGALNLCIPTTLLKRPSFDVKKLADTFAKEKEKAKFKQWKAAKYIIVYDASSAQIKDATSAINTLKKFNTEGWQGTAYIIRGGHSGFSKKFPDRIDNRRVDEMEDYSSTTKLSIEPPAGAPVAGGCLMPKTVGAANPFFGNIRQNMDLIGGVGQMPVKLPTGVTDKGVAQLPTWLRRVTDERNKGQIVADRFLSIEKAEQQRMQEALSANVSYGTPKPISAESIQIAGIEKGTKNRYKDMLPYDHSRVKLQNVSQGDCDYVNASHLAAQWSNKHYIASQAPVPTTFQDFWRVVWEQDARVIVMLTAESEGGQRKCHPYWLPGDYGPFNLKSLSERRVSLETPKRVSTHPILNRSDSKPSRATAGHRPSMPHRSSTHHGSFSRKSPPDSPSPDLETPHVFIRKLSLSHAARPFEPLREITQLQYSSWPDFGAPAHPAHVLGLVQHCGRVVNSYADSGTNNGIWKNEPAGKGERPVVVHCSAGCGRTGTFCTVDSVVDMLKRQRLQYQKPEKENNKDSMDMDVDDEEHEDEADTTGGKGWLMRDDNDLVAKTVEDFRHQRLSMVQTLRQFVLCYESVLEWIVGEMEAEGGVRQRPRLEGMESGGRGKSYHGR